MRKSAENKKGVRKVDRRTFLKVTGAAGVGLGWDHVHQAAFSLPRCGRNGADVVGADGRMVPGNLAD